MDWKIDPKTGKRYRDVSIGDRVLVREYEMEIGGIPASELHEHNRRMREERERQRQEEELRAKEPVRLCPFNGLSDCKGESCAFYSVSGCAKGAGDTEGKKCPICNFRKCMRMCFLYSEGCTLVKK